MQIKSVADDITKKLYMKYILIAIIIFSVAKKIGHLKNSIILYKTTKNYKSVIIESVLLVMVVTVSFFLYRFVDQM
jgi:hypothetical protein